MAQMMAASNPVNSAHFAAPQATSSRMYAQSAQNHAYQQAHPHGARMATGAGVLPENLMLPPSQTRKADIEKERRRAATARRQEQQDRAQKEQSMEKANMDLFARPEKVCFFREKLFFEI